jgi:hypothetical protein
MNCERCQTELEDFLYGELSERLAAEMRAHLADCADCVAVRDDLETESALFAQFYEQTAIEPTGEMWEAIRQRIAAEPARHMEAEARPNWWQSLFGGWLTPVVMRQVALALLLVALSVTATVLLMRRGETGQNLTGQNPKQTVTPTPQTIVTPNPVPAPTTDLATTAQEKPVKPATTNQSSNIRRAPVEPQKLSDQELLVRQLAKAEREYRGAIKMLDQAIARRRDKIEPEAFKQYESSLALIDNSIAQSKRALREQPSDLAAGQFLLAAYAKKVELMQTIAMN